MGTAGWAKIDGFYLETERFGQSYGMNMFYEKPDKSMVFIDCLTPEKARKLGESLFYWADEEKESGRELLKTIPEREKP
jgi:hypothetical protein